MADIKLYEDIQNADQSSKELLVHVGLVKRVALHLKGRLPNFMELDELIQVGMIGLIEAKSSFDASKGVEFEIFGSVAPFLIRYASSPIYPDQRSLVSANTTKLRPCSRDSSVARPLSLSWLSLWAKI